MTATARPAAPERDVAPLVPEPTESLPSLRSTYGLLSWIASVDHKQIGIMYILFAIVFLVVGGFEALLMRIQLGAPNNTFLSPQVYNQLFTMHGTTMVFLMGMPLVAGIGNYVVPLQIGAPDAGWFAYPPYSERVYSTTPGMDYWSIGLLVAGIGSVAGAINFIVTIL